MLGRLRLLGSIKRAASEIMLGQLRFLGSTKRAASEGMLEQLRFLGSTKTAASEGMLGRLRLLGRVPASGLLRPLGAGLLAVAAGSALCASPSTPLAECASSPGEGAHEETATQRLLVWLAHARARADAILADPPVALRRFGEGWRELVGLELCATLDEGRLAVEQDKRNVIMPLPRFRRVDPGTHGELRILCLF
ncbi:hypothetical protein T492DRAFT_832721 [Pavlovales sp. CCMP2436]|nr:hypothetical protein T492DRAFT_832721 [Pavlovales sp. CCMP2436]